MKTKNIWPNIVVAAVVIFIFSFQFCLAAGFGSEVMSGIPPTGLPDSPGGIKVILIRILNWLLGIVGMLAIIAFAISGIQYFSAVGDDKRMETAKRNMVYSIIGIVVALSGFILVKAINTALNAGGMF